MLPQFDSNGDLPVGVHPASSREVGNVFGSGNRERSIIFQRLERIHQIAVRTGHLARFIVFGSFVTEEERPNDVDVFIVFDDSFDASTVDAEASVLLDHGLADAHFGASVFWLRRPAAFGGEDATIEFWQTKRDGTQRGIVEIVEKSDDSE